MESPQEPFSLSRSSARRLFSPVRERYTGFYPIEQCFPLPVLVSPHAACFLNRRGSARPPKIKYGNITQFPSDVAPYRNRIGNHDNPLRGVI
jgi:hypothetical protein